MNETTFVILGSSSIGVSQKFELNFESTTQADD